MHSGNIALCGFDCTKRLPAERRSLPRRALNLFDVMVATQVSERDDRLLTDQLLALEKANQEVAGDEDSEGEEPEGMCAPCQGFPSVVQPCPGSWN